MSGEPRLIVNADDLGRTDGINTGVFAAHRGGLVTSATLMVGFAAAARAAATLRREADLAGLGVGLHVTLTGGGPPTLPPARVPSLVDAAGRLPREVENLDAANPDELRAEIDHQVARFRDLMGRLPTHLDGHHHVHRSPPVLEIVVAVAAAHRLPVRRASPAVAARLERAGVPTSDHFVARFFGEDARLEVLLEILASLPAGTTELMCHPGLTDDELAAGSSYATERERELAVLTHPEAARRASELGIRLVHFGVLARPEDRSPRGA